MLTVRVKHDIDPNIRERLFVQAVKAGMEKALLLWHVAFAPMHFKAGAAARYGYQKRSEKYEKRKERVKHHRQPLVWSGTLRDSIVKGRPTPKFRTDKTGTLKGYIVYKVPKYAYQYRGDGPKKMDEVFATTEFEAAQMSRVMWDEIHRVIDTAKQPTRRRIGAA